MSVLVLYDDREPMSEEGRGAIGVDRYGQLRYRKSSLRERMLDRLVADGCTQVEVLNVDADIDTVVQRWRQGGDHRVLVYLPAVLTWVDKSVFSVFVRKLPHVADSYAAICDDDEHHPLLVVTGGERRALLDRLRRCDWREFCDEHRAALRTFPQAVTGLRSLRRFEHLLEFLSSTFDVRHFNRLSDDGAVLTKRSTDVDKMRREHRVFELLPPPMRLWYLPPLGYQENGDEASYTIERLNVPDMAVQWIHQALTVEDFGRLIDRVVGFLQARPTRPIGDQAVQALYLGKVDRRLGELAALPEAVTIDRLVDAALGSEGGCGALRERFATQWRRLAPRRGRAEAAVSHGDLCFSNILYGRQGRLLKFIDPRGGDELDDLYLDAYYDVAKLSHSVLGLYDFVNHDLCELVYDRDLRLRLQIAAPDLSRHQQVFVDRLLEAGFDPTLMRLYEASLFLSMLPLHVDVPKKVVGFALIAAGILEQLEAG